MTQDASQSSENSARHRYSRAFRPLTCWVLISIGLLAWDYHRRNAPRTTLKFEVRIDGRVISDRSAYTATLGKWRVESGRIAPIGKRVLTVAMPDTDPVQKPVFVWYGENEVGEIDLDWNRGVLDLSIEPAAKLVRLTGPHHASVLTNTTGTKISVPVGNYKIVAVFDQISEERDVLVSRNETTPFVIKPNVGSVSVKSIPDGAMFMLSARGRTSLTRQGDVPALLTGLPVGNYQLRVSRGDYTKDVPVEVKKWETNQVNVVFEYGEVKITSEPDGASIFSSGNELGKTPQTLTQLKPGPYRFRLEKAGYLPAEIGVDLLGRGSITIATNLVNIRYAQGIANARRELSGSSPDYRKALASVEQSLSEAPADAEAISLKAQIEVGLVGQVEREEQQAQIAALDARKRAAKQTFDQAIATIPQTELYDAHLWEFRAPLAKVRDALLRTITKTAPTWNLGKEVRVNAETLIFSGTSKGILSSGKQFVILASQVDSDLVQIHAKFWDFTMATSRALPAYRGSVELPLNAKFFLPEEAANIAARRREIPDNVRTVLQKELQ